MKKIFLRKYFIMLIQNIKRKIELYQTYKGKKLIFPNNPWM